jgi:DNA-directed RNA polymerase subunit M/transcription elongation factor TFIIS
MKKILSKLYILVGLVATVFFTILIWNVTFGKIIKEYRDRQQVETIIKDRAMEKQKKERAEASFKKAILESEETVKHYLGYRVLEQRFIKGHFHHIDFDFKPDNRNYCIDCHGDIPHDKVKQLRAFDNMHASFIACQTCHVRLEGNAKTGVFKWYDRETGEIIKSPVTEETAPGTYNAKILPFERVNGTLQAVDTPERIAFAREYRETEATLSEVQKSKAKKIIHNIVSQKPYICEECHHKESSLLPFKELGYPPHRIDTIVSTEVIGMIKKYTEFYIPILLEPGVGSKFSESEEGADKQERSTE